MRRAGQLILGFGVVGAILFAIGVANPPVPRPITTDRLGPESGELVADYASRSRASLDGLADSGPHWGLVSFGRAVGIERVRDVSATARVSQIVFQAQLDRVQTPAIPVAIGASDAAIERAAAMAGGTLRRTVAPDERSADVLRVSAERVDDGCDCVVALLVRAESESLRAMAEWPDVRVVEALGTDPAYGTFGMRTLLPEHVDVVQTGPDDGPVPER
ncbi:hypothetical protein [Rhodococcus sp. NPDC058521]|uniref:hypothetical protein n=1 Tax=Rhodococcus sp. NPDC058521 TaxID=3346536 RepID=UPI003654DAE4